MSKIHTEITIEVGGKYLINLGTIGGRISTAPEIQEVMVKEIVTTPAHATLFLLEIPHGETYVKEPRPATWWERFLRRGKKDVAQHRYVVTATYVDFMSAFCERQVSVTVGI